jgi:hypothetical protein
MQVSGMGSDVCAAGLLQLDRRARAKVKSFPFSLPLPPMTCLTHSLLDCVATMFTMLLPDGKRNCCL